MTPSEDPEITVKLPRSMWQTIIDSQPMAQETYTPEGERIFAAYQAIVQQAGLLIGEKDAG